MHWRSHGSTASRTSPSRWRAAAAEHADAPERSVLRLFLAIGFAPELTAAMHEAVQPLREIVTEGASWTPASKLHLTVKFLGEQPDDAPARLLGAVQEAAERHQPLPMTVGGVGAFPHFRRARVLWIGVEPDARLELLHHDVEERCAAHGFELEGRPFRPHVTVGRLQVGCPEETARALARAARRVQLRETVLVSSIEIVQSALGRAGATHTVLHSIPLNGTSGSWAASHD